MNDPIRPRSTRRILVGFLFAWLAAPATPTAQTSGAGTPAPGTYTLAHFVPFGGGGLSSNAVYSVTGLIGEAAAGPRLKGGGYALDAGHQTVLATLHLPEGPIFLRVTQTGASVEISWPADFDGDGAFVLETTPTLELPTPWQPVRELPLVKDGARAITLPAHFNSGFFRLRRSTLP